MQPAEKAAAPSKTVLFDRPQVIYVDEDYSVKAPPYSSIDKIIESLEKFGPLVALNKAGPAAYSEAPFKLKDRVKNVDIYGWKPNTRKKSEAVRLIILGAQKNDSKEYVYYTLAQDITRDTKSLIRGYRPLSTDTKVYVMSFENFLNYLEMLDPICPQAQWLYSVEVNSILDMGEGEKKCKEVGQKIFDHYKTAKKGDSEAGKEALERICNAARFLTDDGAIRKEHIRRAWSKVGDENWTWMG